MTYRGKLNEIGKRLHDGPLSDAERIELGNRVFRHATRVGHIEEIVDDMAEDCRQQEAAGWNRGSEPSGRFVQ